MGLQYNLSLKFLFQWKALSDTEKTLYEEKCKELNKENARKYAADHSLADEQ